MRLGHFYLRIDHNKIQELVSEADKGAVLSDLLTQLHDLDSVTFTVQSDAADPHAITLCESTKNKSDGFSSRMDRV